MAAASLIGWLTYVGSASWIRGRRAVAVGCIVLIGVVGAAVSAFVLRGVESKPLDIASYPAAARILVVAIFTFVGWATSKTALRRWRSGVSIAESQAAYRAGRWAGYSTGATMVLLASCVALGVVMALPEWLIGI